MRLTVGPLPPAVYWRRRAVVFGILLVGVSLIVYQCSGPGATSAKNRVMTPTTGSPTPAASATATAGPGSGGLGDQGDGGTTFGPASGSATPTGSPQNVAAQSGPCADDEISVAAAAEPPSVARAAFVKLTLKIKNISNRSCTRDVGADPQELYLQDAAKVKIWSSDTCAPLHGSDVRLFRPGDVA